MNDTTSVHDVVHEMILAAWLIEIQQIDYVHGCQGNKLTPAVKGAQKPVNSQEFSSKKLI